MVFYNKFNLIVSPELCDYAKKRYSEIEQECTMTQQMEWNKMTVVCENEIPDDEWDDFGSEDDVWYNDKKRLKDFLDEVEDNLFNPKKIEPSNFW